MVICSLDALEKSSKKKETRIKKEIVKVLQQPSYCQKGRPEVLYKKVVLRNFTKFTGKYLCQSFFFNKVAQVFSCEFCQIFKNGFFHRATLVATSVP